MWLRLILMLTGLILAVTGCGSGSGEEGAPAGDTSGTERADSANGQDDGPGAPGAPANENNGQAPGSPIDIPDITGDLDKAQDELEASLRSQCPGNTLCVRIVVKQRDPDRTACEFVTTDPPPGSRVKPGSVVAIITGTRPCAPESSDAESGDGNPSPEQTSPEANTETSGDTASPDAGSPS